MSLQDQRIKFALKDSTEETDAILAGHIDITDEGIDIHFHGYGTRTERAEEGHPVYISNVQGKVRIALYEDITQDEPTYVTDIREAKLRT